MARRLYREQAVNGVYRLDEGALLDDFCHFLQPLGIESRNAPPASLFSAEALMRLVGLNAPKGRHGVRQRGAAKRQCPCTEGPICADALANNIIKLHLWDLEFWFNGTVRALAKAGVFRARVKGIADAAALEATAAYAGCGQVTR